jgi:hypothetical protein
MTEDTMQLMAPADVARVRTHLLLLSLRVLRVDLGHFIQTAEHIQALGQEPGNGQLGAGEAGRWAELARLLTPFRDEASSVISRIRYSQAAAEPRRFLPESAACPSCGERRITAVIVNDNGSLLCETCYRRYRR